MERMVVVVASAQNKHKGGTYCGLSTNEQDMYTT